MSKISVIPVIEAVQVFLDVVFGTMPHYFLIKDTYEISADMKGQI
jgi:hypothetical protein